MLSIDVTDALIAAADEAANAKDARSDNLRRQVYAAVDELKAAGMPPSRIVVTLRTLITVSTAGLYPVVTEWLEAWCNERYFEGMDEQS